MTSYPSQGDSSRLQRVYDGIMRYAHKPQAMYMLAAVSFAESSFFPFPPDPLFIAMLVAHRKRWFFMAFLCTVSSVLGGIVGYYIGYAFYETVGLWLIKTYGMGDSFASMRESFQDWGFWFIALKGLTPIPYKIVTIASGLAQYNLLSFIVASIIARSFRFFLLASILYYFGPQVKNLLDRHLKSIFIFGTMLLIGGFFLIQYLSQIKDFFMSFL